MEKENESSPGGNENKNQPEKSEKEKQKEAQIEINYVRLKNKPEVSEFLKPYNGDLTEFFLKNYARRKNHSMEHRAYYEQRKEEKELELRNIARETFTCLMKIKMSDLRREWGAGLVELPGISNAFDFITMVDDVFSVSWIPPISEADMQCLLNYVAQHNKGYDLAFMFSYESKNFTIPLYYDELGAYDMESSLACFYKEQMDTEKLRLIPDKRGDIAMYYVRADIRSKLVVKNKQIEKGELPPDKEVDMRPFPPDDSAFMELFIKKCDDKETLYCYELYKEYHKKDEEEDEQGETVTEKVETILARLKNINGLLPITTNADWRLALIESWNEYRKKSIAETIEQVYEEYLFHAQAGIAYYSEKIKPETIKKAEILKKKFLNGRELMGKPRDFNI